MARWEHWTAAISTIAEADALGAEGWELAGFLDGVAWFRRDVQARELRDQAQRQAGEHGKATP